MYQPLTMKVLSALCRLQGHLNDLLGGEGARAALAAAKFAAQQESLHVLVAGVGIEQERCAFVLDGDAEDGKQGGVAQAVQCETLAQEKRHLWEIERYWVKCYVCGKKIIECSNKVRE